MFWGQNNIARFAKRKRNSAEGKKGKRALSKTIQTIYKVKVWPLGRGGTPELFYFDHPDLWVDFIGEVRDLGFEYKVNYDKSARLYRSKHDDDQKAVQRALSRVMDIATAA